MAFVWQPVWKNSELKPIKFRLKTDIASHSADGVEFG